MSDVLHTVTTIGVFNQKGGVGKTTISAILAEYLALEHSMNCLVIDADMQCNSSEYWIGMEPAPNEQGGQLPPKHPEYDPDDEDADGVNERSTIADIFYGKTVMPYSTYFDGQDGNGTVDILLGHPYLLEKVNSEFDNKSGLIEERVTNQMGRFLHHPSVEESYDVVIIDTGPSRNPVFRSAMRAATHALIPFEPEAKSLQGINAMLQAVRAENYARTSDTRQLELIGLLPNKVRSNTNLHKETLAAVRAIGGGAMSPDDIYLPHTIAFPNVDMKGANPNTVFGLPKSHPGRRQAEIVGRWVYDIVFNSAKTEEEQSDEGEEALRA